jgi:hypothetical protein
MASKDIRRETRKPPKKKHDTGSKPKHEVAPPVPVLEKKRKKEE